MTPLTDCWTRRRRPGSTRAWYSDSYPDLLDRCLERIKQARLDLIHRVRRVMPGLVTERRTWPPLRWSEPST
jgi:hypothetical protein